MITNSFAGTYTISKEIQFDAGHRVPGHEGKCKNPHGHRYRVVVHCTGNIIEEPGHPEEGMLTDFGFLKQLLTEVVHDPLDHGFVYYEKDEVMANAFANMYKLGDAFKVIVFPYVPTAENIARWCWEGLENQIRSRGLQLACVEVWETPTSMAKASR